MCAKANAVLPDDPSYVKYLEELFGCDLLKNRIITPFICDFGNRVKFGECVFTNRGFNKRHTIYTYGKVLIKKKAWIGMGAMICPEVTIGAYVVAAMLTRSAFSRLEPHKGGAVNARYETSCASIAGQVT